MSVLGKLLEKSLKERINIHLESHGLIRDNQHSFVRGQSCLSNLIEFFQKLIDSVDEESAVGVVYVDFNEAFDKVPHGRPIEKVKHMEFRETW